MYTGTTSTAFMVYMCTLHNKYFMINSFETVLWCMENC